LRATIYILILLLILPLFIFPFLTFNNRETVGKITTYSLDSDQADYAMGTIMYESKSYNTNYEEHRVEAFEKLERSADHSFGPAQYYLGKLYLTDALIIDSVKGIELIKMAAYQNEEDAIQYLVDNNIPLPPKQTVEYKYIFYILPLLIIHIILSMLLSFWSYKKEVFDLKRIILIWLLPYIGGIISLITIKKKSTGNTH
jgi:hypothetical protein